MLHTQEPSLVSDHLLYSHDCNVGVGEDIVWGN